MQTVSSKIWTRVAVSISTTITNTTWVAKTKCYDDTNNTIAKIINNKYTTEKIRKKE